MLLDESTVDEMAADIAEPARRRHGGEGVEAREILLLGHLHLIGVVPDHHIVGVERTESDVMVRTGDDEIHFDEVIFACHGDQALAILQQPTEEEHNILSQFQFSDNRVVLHTDSSHLPRRKNAWASWNYRITERGAAQSTLTYNMNILQRLQKEHTYLVTLNQDIDRRHIIAEFNYSHPVYNVSMIEAQQQWPHISGIDRLHYCGAYWHNGFHEDGVRSAVRVCNMLEAD